MIGKSYKETILKSFESTTQNLFKEDVKKNAERNKLKNTLPRQIAIER